VNRGSRLLISAVCLVSASCAPRLVTLPSGAGSPFPDYLPAFEQATGTCGGVRTMAAVLAISGRAGGQRFRAKIDAGLAAPASVRLELPAPGKSFFVYVATGDSATLLLPREGRVLRDAPPAATLEALAGVAIGPEDLRRIVAGCGLASEAPTGGREFPGGWVAVESGPATTWLQQVEGSWRLMAASRTNAGRGLVGPLEVRYADLVAGRPSTIRLRTLVGSANAGRGAVSTDLTIRLSQVDINEPIDSQAFLVDVPPDATPMTLDELRQAGPLGR
jgi:outer membrane lipoprotein-sorting protein